MTEDPRWVGGYRVLGRLGAGGMGTVYYGTSPSGLPVAIKVIHAQQAQEPSFRSRFAREVTAARAVSGAFTAPVIDADPEAATPWLVTGYLPGMSLNEAVKAWGPFPVPAVFGLGASLAEALVSVHQAGIVHRDLKPGNVMLAPDGPRLIDFGIAHASDTAGITQAGTVMGSPGFLAPEQAVGGTTGPPGDVFALGSVLTFAATGQSPFGRAGGAEALIYRVVHDEPMLGGVTDPELRSLIAACLVKDPAKRPSPRWLLPRLAARAPGPEALQGTGWLPDPVAEGISRSEGAVPSRGPGRRTLLLAGLGAVAVLGGGSATAVAFARSGDARKTVPTPPPPAGNTPTPAAAVIPVPTKGKRLWKRDAGVDPYSGLTVAGDTVCVGGDQGNLIGLKTGDGKRRWGHRTGGRGAGAATWRQPVASGGAFYAGWADERGPLYAFDAATGAERWRAPMSHDVRTPTVGGGLVFVGSGDGFHAVDAATGKARWQRPIGGVLTSTPCFDAGTVFVDTQDGLYALNAASGATRWHWKGGGGRPSAARAPAAGGGRVFFPDAKGTLHALDAKTGKELWTYAGGASVGLPTLAGQAVYVADGSANIAALDAANGAVRWLCPTAGKEIGRPWAADGMLCLTVDEDAVGIQIVTGHIRWRAALGSRVRGDASAAGSYYVACEDGGVHAFTVKGA
ncbi:outer membrane protein assembly factor BamB family protein [Spirillospora sp. NBC_01491]|uniref:outer membrane protein assembly factor BamB family protein n=1 Tax=Spirillospora sp. NBC_01491 TaxID=2976007 RepID=UPI002E31BEE5|nr:PQQ-binding-like beta-propeller repeat protein [Spirillospora sp. NBC_01491]